MTTCAGPHGSHIFFAGSSCATAVRASVVMIRFSYGFGTGQEALPIGLVPPWPGAWMLTRRGGPQEESTGRPTGLRRLPVPWVAQGNGRPSGPARVPPADAARGQLSAFQQRSCWSGSGSAPAASCGGAHRRGRGDDEHLQAAGRRVLSLTCSARLAPGIAAQRNTRPSPPDGTVVESSKGVPLERPLKPGLVGILAPSQRYPRPSRRGRQCIAADVG